MVNDESALIVHLGDSRVYRLRGNEILFRTQDHSLVGELVANKVLSEEQARLSPQSNVITRGLGSISNNQPEIDIVPYCKGDRFILCTDGVWGVMPQPDLIQRLGASVELEQLVDNVQDEIDRIGVSEDGHHDNHTLAIIEMAQDSKLKDKMSKKHLIVLCSLASLLLVSVLCNIVLLSRSTVQTDYQEEFAPDGMASAVQDTGDVAGAAISQYVNVRMESTYRRLNEQLDSFQRANDSLENELVKIKTSQALDKTSTKLGHEAKDGESSKSKDSAKGKENVKDQTGPKSPIEIIEVILSLYSQSEKAQDKDSKQLIRRLLDYKNRIHQLLKELPEEKSVSAKPSSIIRLLPSNKDIEQRVEKKDGLYCPTKSYIHDLSKSKKKVEELKRNYSK